MQLLASLRGTWIPLFFAIAAIFGLRPAAAQPGPNDPPITYEVQIDGESFQVEGNQRPIKVESKLKQGTTYNLAVRVAMTQPLRLNTVQLEYGMWATVVDNQGKNLRVAKIVHELGFSLEITDLGQVLDAKHQDDLLKTLTDSAVKRFTDSQATGLKQTGVKVQRFGSSDAKWLKINYADSGGAARTCMIFVLSGEKYTIARWPNSETRTGKTWGPG